MTRPVRIAAIGLAAAASLCFFAALHYPAVGTCYAPGSPLPDWFENQNILLFGWMAIFVGQIGWYANIPFAAILISLMRGRRPPWYALAAQVGLAGLGIATLQPAFGMMLPHNEGYSEPVCWLGIGFWLWGAAQLLAFCGALLTYVKTDRMD